MMLIDDAIEHVTESGERLGMRRFLRYLIDTDQRFNTTGGGIRAAVRIEWALGRDPLALEDSDYELIVAASEAPSAGYPMVPSRHCLKFIDGLKAAKAYQP